MGNYRPFLQGPLPVANYTRIIIPGRFWTRPPSTKSTRMASSATPLHDSLIELAIPDAHAHAIKWYLNSAISASPHVHGAEYEYSAGPNSNIFQHNVPCAVCYASSGGSRGGCMGCYCTPLGLDTESAISLLHWHDAAA